MSLNLADLEAPIEPVRLPGGREVAVVPMDGIAYDLLLALRKKEKAEVGSSGRMLWDIAARCIPDATPEEVGGLSVVMANAVIGLATRTLDAVAAEAPRPPAATGPAPAPAAPSGTSAGA